jgi:hypothetical protein
MEVGRRQSLKYVRVECVVTAEVLSSSALRQLTNKISQRGHLRLEK